MHSGDLEDRLSPGERPVAVMDSGVGGLPYLARIRELLPAERFVYLADRAGFPYGVKSGPEIEAVVLDRVARLVAAHSPKLLVIACNTASQAALAATRRAFPVLTVVGTVPAVKPAAERSRSGAIGVMATAKAVGDPYLDALVARHAPGKRVFREAAQDLVAFVERRFVDSSAAERRAAVAPYVERLVAAGADEIVLACTHFLHVAEDIRAYAEELAGRAGPDSRVEVVDSRDGVARRVVTLLREGGLLAPAGLPAAPGRFLLTGEPPFEPGYAAFASRFGLSAPEALAAAAVPPVPGGAE